MRLRTNIVLWVILATVLPLVILVTGANVYSEWRYRQEVDSQMTRTLDRLVAQLDQRLVFDRALVSSLLEVPDLQDFLPVLAASARGDLHPEYFERSERLGRLLESFQGALPSISAVRILDTDGASVITARLGVLATGLPTGEEDLLPSQVLNRLNELPLSEIHFQHIPFDDDDSHPSGLLDAVIPLKHNDLRVGFLVARLDASAYDRLLDRIPRPYGAQILLLEGDSEQPERDRLPLYVDGTQTRFQKPITDLKLDFVPALWEAMALASDGVLQNDLYEIHYTEYLPYQGRLGFWVLGLRLDLRDLSLPFRRIGLGIILFAAVAVGLSLLLARIGARKLAQPVSELSDGLEAFANGEIKHRFSLRGPTEIRQLQSSFNTMADTLVAAEAERDQARDLMLRSAKLASLGQLAAGIGHEINNPLNNILALVRLMEKEAKDAPKTLRDDLGSLRDEANRASRIVAGILDFARQKPPEKTLFQLQPWLEETARLLKHAADARDIEVRIEPAPDLMAYGDRSQLQQVLVNLGLNAIQASPTGRHIQIQARESFDFLEITVRDLGDGIDPTAFDKLFDPFFTTKEPGQGSGLGLSISQSILEHHDGKLRLENHPDGGALARLQLPTFDES